ncbi:hypothetical protein M2349_001937 [Caldanaerobacter subterraneus subsp. tengcongensis MB4]|uniref:Uncharacterized protein n=1 Tax=Caldanaerobacter subterraneus subsp. tengcongensis (strain DSM 15242 / JCM 11007 / NBRC 100824 / MB4) TaxID=273068 RepID=Q8RCK2_CALS4|nr:hypothetical protein [Caldanaerobacter subterraneus]AAM23709.1 hypothetical protein TTE0425 [Caldanaerobacter subterraneus subsp. tengcongensis MB4]MCS3916796.1 hypothetical protein [Caldanaerobacter subterraneus subsp. tengcongensis MB4]
MATLLKISTGPNHNADPQNEWNVTAKKSFRVIITAYDVYGNVDTSYNKIVNIYADDGKGNYPYQIGSAQALNGQATVWCNPLTIIYGTNPFRYIIARDIDGLQSLPIRIAVYFYVYGSIEFHTNCDGTLSYGAQTACVPNGLPPNSIFVALPATGLCNKSIYISTSSTGTFKKSQILDVGPWRTNDPYWNTGNYGIYRADIDISDGLATQLGIPYGCNGSTPWGGAYVLWRFS